MKQYNLIWTCIFTGLVTAREIISHNDIDLASLTLIAEVNGLTFDLKG